MATPRIFTEKERAILQIVQKNIPDTEEPFAEIARLTGSTEEEVLCLLRTMRDEGSIRRFGASLKHQKAGFAHNAMVAWVIDEADADWVGEKVAEHPMVSHCYFRKSSTPDWPYEFFTMIHGKNPGDCEAVIEALRATTSLDEYAILESVREMKKTSMTYF